uniref:Uncharacterized protein n=1 Tax=Plectus sambesii TaxID=2011161 RepID=A0A914X904_9BILA
MEGDYDYEIDTNGVNKRSKGRKNRQSKECKKFAKSGIVRKLIGSNKNGAAVSEKPLPEEPQLARRVEQEVQTDDNIAHAPHPTEKDRQQMFRRRCDVRRADRLLSAHPRHMAEREVALNGPDEDYFSNSDTESDATEDEDYERVDNLSDLQQYSLFDYVTIAEKKPKRSEGFVFVNAP